MAAPYAGSVTSSQVGSYFVGQYYQVLQTTPEYAHQFYKDGSTMVLVDGDSSQTASTMMQIHTLLTSLNSTGIEIKTINSLESWDGGILVMVSGSIKSNDFNGKRRFVQSFFLARQENGYFVLNDIFQFIDEERNPLHLVAVQSETKLESQVSPVTIPEQPDYVPEEEARDYVNSVHVEDDTVDKYSLPDQQQLQNPEFETVVEETPAEESSSSLQSAVNTIQDSWGGAVNTVQDSWTDTANTVQDSWAGTVNTVQDSWAGDVEEPAGEREKKTYASILRVPKGPSLSSVVPEPLFRKSSPPVSDPQYTPEPPVQQSNTSSSYVRGAIGEAAEEGSALEEGGEFKSVYVRNLPSAVTNLDIEEEFKNFGTIKPDGVFIRNLKDVDACYAFVEYEDIIGVRNAIKASPIQLAGRQVFIEERRPNSNSTFRGGRRGRGRGGYQTEATRGRFAGRGEYNRPRGNGLYQRSSRQGY